MCVCVCVCVCVLLMHSWTINTKTTGPIKKGFDIKSRQTSA